MKYVKRMVKVDAFQYDGDLIGNDGIYYVPEWAERAHKKGILFFSSPDVDGPPAELYIRKLDGEAVHVPVGNYIFGWYEEDLFTCEPEVFESTYELAVDEIKAKAHEIALEYGYDTQSRQMIEEMAELTQAINKYCRKDLDCGKRQCEDGYLPMLSSTYGAVLEEMADVQIMIWQMAHLLNANISPLIKSKIDRQMERIAEKHKKAGGDGA